MYCPKCRKVELEPTKLEEGLPTMGCPACNGSLLSLLYYRDWAERVNTAELSFEQKDLATSENDAKAALSCPKCGKLMTKFAVTGRQPNRIDMCNSCDEAWLDAGEWEFIKSLKMADKLSKVFTDQWQKKVRSEKMEALKVSRLQKEISDKDVERAVKVKAWLARHPKKSVILQFLGSD